MAFHPSLAQWILNLGFWFIFLNFLKCFLIFKKCLYIHIYIYIYIYIFFFFFGHAMQLAGSQFPSQDLNLGPRQWKHRVLTTGLPGKSLLDLVNSRPGLNPKFTTVARLYKISPLLLLPVSPSTPLLTLHAKHMKLSVPWRPWDWSCLRPQSLHVNCFLAWNAALPNPLLLLEKSCSPVRFQQKYRFPSKAIPPLPK